MDSSSDAFLFTSSSSFRSTVNHFAGHNAYQKTVTAGAGSGLYPTHGYSFKETLGAVYYAWGLSLFTFGGYYLTAEFRRAGKGPGGGAFDRQRQPVIELLEFGNLFGIADGLAHGAIITTLPRLAIQTARQQIRQQKGPAARVRRSGPSKPWRYGEYRRPAASVYI